MSLPKVCLIGQVMVDVTFPGRGREPKLRLGGIAHAARALWAMDCPYVMAYIAPEYLDGSTEKHAASYGHAPVRKIGNVLGCPNVVTISEPTEAGPQGYEFLLRDEQNCLLDSKALAEACHDDSITDFLIFPGGFDLAATLKEVGKSPAAVHIDANFQPTDPETFGDLGRRFTTIILSTSSHVFLEGYGGKVTGLCERTLGTYAEALLLKENRGGSRFFRASEPREPVLTPAHLRPIQHSVGVGDVFDATYVVTRHGMEEKAALGYSSLVAAEYASTTYPDDFKEATLATLKIPRDTIAQLEGVSLVWEDRPSCQVYIAAPDFDYVDRRPIEEVVACLKYHNFTPRRPVIENGQMGLNAGPERRQKLCDADVKLIEDCQVMLAVLLFDDPGTLIEIGMAVQRGMPVIVYDPFHRADNLMLTQLPDLVSSSLDEVISAVFKHAARRRTA
jgi:nucleoside 2-deoxyribosyltransferase